MGGHDSTKMKVILIFFAIVLLGFALLFLGGCREAENRGLNTGGATIKAAEGPEAQLLTELNRKFENPDTHCKLGRLYHTQENWDKAEYHYNVALGFDPAHRPTQAAQVRMFVDKGDMAKAEQFASNYKNQVSASPRESISLGQEFEKEQLDEYALACYQQAIRVGSHLAEVNRQVGYYYLRCGDKTKAKEYLQRSFELNPNQSDVAGQLGRLGVAVQVPRKSEQNLSR